MYRFTLSTLSLAMLVSFSHAHAEEQEPDRIVITATKTPQLVENTLSDVSIITQDDIQKSGASNLEELLRRTSGIQVVNNGGRGSTSNLFIRGTSSSQSIVLVDGVRQMQATNGGSNFQYIPLDQIDRIEVVRGSASSLYGADAMGGVVQIFTKTPTEGHHQNASIGIGAYNATESNVGATGRFGKLGYQVNVSHEEVGGFSNTNSAAKYNYNPDKDGYRNTTISGKLDFEWLTGQNLRVSAYHGKGNSEFDSNTILQDETNYKIQQFTVESDNTLISDKLRSILKYSEFEDKSTNIYHSPYAFDKRTKFNTKTKNASWTLHATPADQLNILLGFDWKKDSALSYPENFDKTTRDNKAVFIGADWGIQNHLLEGSLRYDDNQQFGNKTTGRVAYGYKITSNLTAKASYATGFRAPTFNDLYTPNSGWSVGNPNLKPETNKNTEIGLSYHSEKVNVDWVAFQNKIKNNIVWDIAAYPMTPMNVEKAEITGTTLSTNIALTDKVIFKFDTTYQDPKNKTLDKTLIRRAKVFGTVGFDFMPDEDWTLTASVYSRGRTYNDTQNKEKLRGYGLVNIGARYQITPTLSTSLSIENLFDKQYTDNKGYNTAGQSVFWRLMYQN